MPTSGPHLYELEYAKDSTNTIALPSVSTSINYSSEVLEQLLKALPHCNGVVIDELHCNHIWAGHDAAFTWHYPKAGYICCTKYSGDGIYNLTGITHDNTVVEIMFDDHSTRVDENFGDMMATELLTAIRKEEEYSHIDDGFGGRRRLCRLPEKLTRAQLLSERFELIEKRTKALNKLKNATGIGVSIWTRTISRYEDELQENKSLLAMVK